MSDAPWYERGLRFECTMCGRCCSGPSGYVLFTDEEARLIAHRLGVSVPEFLRRYTDDTRMEISGRRRSLREVETDHGLDCIFLDRLSMPGKALCTIHEVRPLQCRTFPFWPEHVQSRRAWDSLAQTCEGIGRGPVVPFTEIRVQVEAHRRDRHGG
jgi:Fe-S-cluster containining protein